MPEEVDKCCEARQCKASRTARLRGCLGMLGQRRGNGMKYLVVGALLFSIDTAAFAQAASTPAPPTVAAKKLVQVKPAAPPSRCKLVGTVKGTKLWAGDCVA